MCVTRKRYVRVVGRGFCLLAVEMPLYKVGLRSFMVTLITDPVCIGVDISHRFDHHNRYHCDDNVHDRRINAFHGVQDSVSFDLSKELFDFRQWLGSNSEEKENETQIGIDHCSSAGNRSRSDRIDPSDPVGGGASYRSHQSHYPGRVTRRPGVAPLRVAGAGRGGAAAAELPTNEPWKPHFSHVTPFSLPTPYSASITPLIPLSNILFLSKRLSNALVTSLTLRVSMSGGGYLFLGGSHTRLSL
ncbi:hypothetical protein EVAR_62237_1 [Eumeta japonica]|uniref:Uncharacterized protein n=1 Tax=Eumeta variegata TaxID=151549 RepID=A0A4C1Z5W4_EUMVA|nr:hypothetical protein EVAR_62237_1 [Eumeta japonica]